jgi:hypothetical protein
VLHTVRRRPKWSTSFAVTSSLVAPLTAVLTGCSAGDTMLPTMAVPSPSVVHSRAQANGGALPPENAAPNTFTVTAQQRAYLDALKAAGIRPSSELLALSIGSYVCQARAAKQPDQAVWDYVKPLVRNDVRKTHLNAVAPSPAQVNAATADYIRIATERLC